jgi:hypothetical protein
LEGWRDGEKQSRPDTGCHLKWENELDKNHGIRYSEAFKMAAVRELEGQDLSPSWVMKGFVHLLGEKNQRRLHYLGPCRCTLIGVRIIRLSYDGLAYNRNILSLLSRGIGAFGAEFFAMTSHHVKVKAIGRYRVTTNLARQGPSRFRDWLFQQWSDSHTALGSLLARPAPL